MTDKISISFILALHEMHQQKQKQKKEKETLWSVFIHITVFGHNLLIEQKMCCKNHNNNVFDNDKIHEKLLMRILKLTIEPALNFTKSWTQKRLIRT